MEGAFLFSVIWSVGCTTDGEGRKAFDKFFRNLTLGVAPEGYASYLPEKRPTLAAQPIPLSDDGSSTVYDYLVSSAQHMECAQHVAALLGRWGPDMSRHMPCC